MAIVMMSATDHEARIGLLCSSARVGGDDGCWLCFCQLLRQSASSMARQICAMGGVMRVVSLGCATLPLRSE